MGNWRSRARRSERFDDAYAHRRSGARNESAALMLPDFGCEAMNIGGIIDWHGELEK